MRLVGGTSAAASTRKSAVPDVQQMREEGFVPDGDERKAIGEEIGEDAIPEQHEALGKARCTHRQCHLRLR